MLLLVFLKISKLFAVNVIVFAVDLCGIGIWPTDFIIYDAENSKNPIIPTTITTMYNIINNLLLYIFYSHFHLSMMQKKEFLLTWKIYSPDLLK